MCHIVNYQVSIHRSKLIELTTLADGHPDINVATGTFVNKRC